MDLRDIKSSDLLCITLPLNFVIIICSARVVVS